MLKAVCLLGLEFDAEQGGIKVAKQEKKERNERADITTDSLLVPSSRRMFLTREARL